MPTEGTRHCIPTRSGRVQCHQVRQCLSTAWREPFESHSHWAVGTLYGMSLRVVRNGRITEAFRKYHALMTRCDEGYALAEQDFDSRVYESTIENIESAAWRFEKQFDLPGGWSGQVCDWLWAFRDRELENRDNQGGYPSETPVLDAIQTLGRRFSGDCYGW